MDAAAPCAAGLTAVLVGTLGLAYGAHSISDMLVSPNAVLSWTMHVATLVVVVDFATLGNGLYGALAASLLSVLALPLPCSLLECRSEHRPGLAMHIAAACVAACLFGLVLHARGSALLGCYVAALAGAAVCGRHALARRDRRAYELACMFELCLVAVYVAWRVSDAQDPRVRETGKK
jgi:hypothetical protein